MQTEGLATGELLNKPFPYLRKGAEERVGFVVTVLSLIYFGL